MDVPHLFMHSSVDGHLVFFHFLGCSAVNIHVHLFVCVYGFPFSGYIPGVELLSHSKLMDISRMG